MTYSKILLLLLTISLVSCFTDPIELDLNENNERIVVEAWISDLDEKQIITITKSSNYLGSDPNPKVTGADVQLSNTTGSIYELQESAPGQYELEDDWNISYDDSYTLKITIDGNTYEAEHRLRESPEIDELTIDAFTTDEDSITGYDVLISFEDAPGKGDAYYVVAYEKGSMLGDTLSNGGFGDDEFFDGAYLEEISLGDEDNPFQIGDTVVVELYSIGLETSKFLTDIENEIFRGGPFDAPPANVRSNFDADILGYFIMSGADRKEIVIQ